MFLDFPTMLAPSGEERRTNASAQVEPLDYASTASVAHSQVYGSCAAEAAASES